MCSFCYISFCLRLLLLISCIAISVGLFRLWWPSIHTAILCTSCCTNCCTSSSIFFFSASRSSILSFCSPLTPLDRPFPLFPFSFLLRPSTVDVVSIVYSVLRMLYGAFAINRGASIWIIMLWMDVCFACHCIRLGVCGSANPQGFKSCSIRFQAFLPPGAKWLNDTSCFVFQ